MNLKKTTPTSSLLLITSNVKSWMIKTLQESCPNHPDPITIGVARHWMERACKGGDELATKYLRDQDDLDKIPGGS